MTRIKFAVAFLAVLALAGCYPPVTSSPVGTTAGAKDDPTLTGTWKGTDSEKKVTYLHFLPRPQSDEKMAILVPSGGEMADLMIVTFSTARFGSFGYMNVRFAKSDGKPIEDQPPGTVPVLYRLDAKGALTLALMDEKLVKDAVKAHRLKGTFEKTIGGGDDGDVTITETPAALDRLFAAPSVTTLFAKPFLTLHRVD
jgi:hypothetical protein